MKLYSAKINLAGNNENQVIKENMSAAELKVLEFIHAGKSPVLVDVAHCANVDRTDAKERARLAAIYSKSTQDGYLTGPALVAKLFGVAGVPLPVEYEAPVFVPVEVTVDGEDEGETIVPVKAAPAPKIKPPTIAELTD